MAPSRSGHVKNSLSCWMAAPAAAEEEERTPRIKSERVRIVVGAKLVGGLPIHRFRALALEFWTREFVKYHEKPMRVFSVRSTMRLGGGVGRFQNTVMVFQNGKIVCIGAERLGQAMACIRRVVRIIHESRPEYAVKGGVIIHNTKTVVFTGHCRSRRWNERWPQRRRTGA